MIRQNNVSLRQARQDCGISAAGGLKNVTEFKDRTGASNPSLKQLGGTIMCRSSVNHVQGSYLNNDRLQVSPSSRRNWNEGNVWSPDPLRSDLKKSSGRIYGTGMAMNSVGYGSDVVTGYANVGTIDPADAGKTMSFDISVEQNNSSDPYGRMTIEVIGWTGGWLVGTPKYYESYQFTGNHIANHTWDYTIDGSYPYLTFTASALSGGGGAITITYYDKMRARIK